MKKIKYKLNYYPLKPCTSIKGSQNAVSDVFHNKVQNLPYSIS